MIKSGERKEWRGDATLKLQGYSHLSAEDMCELCKRAGILNPKLRQAHQSAFEKRTNPKSTGRPLNSRKISFTKIFSEFNDHMQLDFMYVKEFGNASALHMIDLATVFSVTKILPSRNIENVTHACEIYWFNVHGSLTKVSGDPDFDNK